MSKTPVDTDVTDFVTKETTIVVTVSSGVPSADQSFVVMMVLPKDGFLALTTPTAQGSVDVLCRELGESLMRQHAKGAAHFASMEQLAAMQTPTPSGVIH